MFKTTVRGLDGLDAAIHRATRQLQNGIEVAVSDTTEGIRDEARYMAPVLSGELRSSIQASAEGSEGEVTVGAEHARFVEFGTSRMAAQPFLFPASEIERNRFVDRVKNAGKRIR